MEPLAVLERIGKPRRSDRVPADQVPGSPNCSRSFPGGRPSLGKVVYLIRAGSRARSTAVLIPVPRTSFGAIHTKFLRPESVSVELYVNWGTNQPPLGRDDHPGRLVSALW